MPAYKDTDVERKAFLRPREEKGWRNIRLSRFLLLLLKIG